MCGNQTPSMVFPPLEVEHAAGASDILTNENGQIMVLTAHSNDTYFFIDTLRENYVRTGLCGPREFPCFGKNVKTLVFKMPINDFKYDVTSYLIYMYNIRLHRGSVKCSNGKICSNKAFNLKESQKYFDLFACLIDVSLNQLCIFTLRK